MKKIKHQVFSVFLILLCSGVAFAQDSGTIFKKGVQAEANLKHQEALKYFKQSLKSEGQTVACLNHISYNLSKLSEKNINQAYIHLKKALIKDPKNEVTLQQMGSIYISQGNLDKAHKILQDLKKMESTEAEILEEKLQKFISIVKKIED